MTGSIAAMPGGLRTLTRIACRAPGTEAAAHAEFALEANPGSKSPACRPWLQFLPTLAASPWLANPGSNSCPPWQQVPGLPTLAAILANPRSKSLACQPWQQFLPTLAVSPRLANPGSNSCRPWQQVPGLPTLAASPDLPTLAVSPRLEAGGHGLRGLGRTMWWVRGCRPGPRPWL